MADDLYGVLGVPKSAEADAIKKTYRKLAKDLHPDRHPGNKKAEERFKKVNHAFQVLSDPKKRQLYDEFGEEGLREGFDPDKVRAYNQWASQQGARGGARGRGPNSAGGVRLEDLFGNTTQGAGDISEVFGDLFGRSRRPRGPVPGQDLQSSVTIDFASAVRGTTLELHPNGTAAAVTVRIPSGASDGSRVRIPAQGAPSPNGGPNGDLLLDIHVQPHRYFRREADDLHIDLPITIAEAIRGAKVKVPTIEGSVTLKVAPGTQSGQVVRLRGKGVARKGAPPGDLYAHFLVQVPVQSSPQLSDLVDKIAAFQTEDPRGDIRL